MERRQFILGLASLAAASSRPAWAQPTGRVPRVGLLLAAYTEADRAGQARVAVFRETLKASGWREDQNLRLQYRWSGGSANIASLAEELVTLAPDVIVVAGDPALTQLQRLPTSIPIVFTQVSEPVDSGFVTSLARPGGHITGFQNFEPAMGGKWLGLLKEIAPQVKRAGALFSSDAAPHVSFLRSARTIAPSLGITVTTLDMQSRDAIERAINEFAGEPNGGLLVFPHPNTISQRGLISAAAARLKLPAIYPYRYFAADGGLMSYGPDQLDQWRGAAHYVDRILKGEKVDALPVQAPTKFELIVNLRTAREIGNDVPAPLLARADAVIE